MMHSGSPIEPAANAHTIKCCSKASRIAISSMYPHLTITGNPPKPTKYKQIFRDSNFSQQQETCEMEKEAYKNTRRGSTVRPFAGHGIHELVK